MLKIYHLKKLSPHLDTSHVTWLFFSFVTKHLIKLTSIKPSYTLKKILNWKFVLGQLVKID